ncbi:ATPase WRNIP1-like [Acanthaster planci]|uniref:ATPase WRNIP1-like n=1 Tax=Acanthaster planci TaxID=133434 RepID=A0A8B7ZT67_ACAPL|nr:ATPase WRNIP1-like [Acanthaster planci]XP_022106666.1 ATPase WRNIP1-like [Acanthaster planci]
MSSQRAQCPICNREFPMQSMNKHIDSCLLEEHDTDDGAKSSDGPPGKTLLSQRKRARLSSEGAQPAASPGFVERMGSGEDASLDKPKEVESDSESGKRKRLNQWGSLLRPVSKPSKAVVEERTANKMKSKLPVSKSGHNLPQKMPLSDLEATPPSLSQSSLSSQELSVQMPARPAKMEFRPLAERVRPRSFAEFVGQEVAIGHRSLLRQLLESDAVPSLIFWGPPGCGKTTLANIIAQRAKASGRARFVSMSATLANVSTVKDAVTAAANEQRMTKRKTILFIDEIHRFNKLQQDTFLPHVENGTITLIGATTENPSFKVNSALLSRCRVIVLNKLTTDELVLILRRAAAELGVAVLEQGKEVKGNGQEGSSDDKQAESGPADSRSSICIEKTALTYLANLCDGDARSALNTLQMVTESQLAVPQQSANGDSQHYVNGPGVGCGTGPKCPISVSHIKDALQRTHVMYDREGDEHYNCISALHKSMRGSDANAALYWLARMLIGGEDPLYIARRLIAFASEDVGLADPQALTQAVSTHQACHFLGVPACEVVLAQCVIYLAKAPKSSMVECALMSVKKHIQEYEGPLPGVPLHLRPASTQLMRDLGHGKGYVHSAAAGDQRFLPECIKHVDFFDNADLFL